MHRRKHVTLRTGGCAQQLLCKIERAALDASMLRVPRGRAAGPGAMSKRRYACVGIRAHVSILRVCLHLRCAELLEASTAESAWNFCAPVVDYNGLRKEVATAFADKIVEVQGLIAKLQKTQRCGVRPARRGGTLCVLQWHAPSSRALLYRLLPCIASRQV